MGSWVIADPLFKSGPLVSSSRFHVDLLKAPSDHGQLNGTDGESWQQLQLFRLDYCEMTWMKGGHVQLQQL